MKKVKMICKIVSAISAIFVLMEFVDIFSKSCMLCWTKKCTESRDELLRYFISAFNEPEKVGAKGYAAFKLRTIGSWANSEAITRLFK